MDKQLELINNYPDKEELFWNYLKSDIKESNHYLAMLLGRFVISDNIIFLGFQYLWNSQPSHLKYSKLGIISRNKYIIENFIINKSDINQIYQFYLKNKVIFSGDQNFWQIVSLLDFIKPYSPEVSRYISEVISYSYGEQRKINPLKVLEHINKILKFSKYY